MKAFIMAALPWICLALAVALFAVNHREKETAHTKGEKYGNFLTEGMCLGMVIGTLFGGNGMFYGMFIGEVIGMCIRKK